MSNIIDSTQLTDMNPAINEDTGTLIADAVNAWIENATSRCWGEQKTVTELQDASGVVWLDHMDVTDVVSVKAGYPGTERVTLDEPYRWTKQGRLILHYGTERALPPSTLDYLEIEYTYGVVPDDVPADLVLAALSLGNAYFEYLQNSGKDVAEASVGSYRLKFAAGNAAGRSATSRDWEVINSYALRRV